MPASLLAQVESFPSIQGDFLQLTVNGWFPMAGKHPIVSKKHGLTFLQHSVFSHVNVEDFFKKKRRKKSEGLSNNRSLRYFLIPLTVKTDNL